MAVPLVRHDGSIFGTLCALDPRPATIDSEVLETFTLLADLVAYQMEEEEERQRREIAEEERRTFVETVAHDLKSPLQVVKSQAQMIQRRLHQNRPLSEEMLGSRLEQIEAAVNRSTELINEMLDASRLRSGQQLELHLESVDLATLVHESVDRERIASSAHEFHIDASETPLIAHIDRSRIARVLGNLLGNATRYSDGGPVRVSIEQETDDAGRWAVISVSDEGIGIPKSDLPHIFERYRRGRNVGQRVVGMGIGLAGSCQIVEQHGGSISVESVEGEGSTFTMRLPLA